MRKIAYLLACVSCMGLGKRLQASFDLLQDDDQEKPSRRQLSVQGVSQPRRALADLLLGGEPATAFSASAPAARSPVRRSPPGMSGGEQKVSVLVPIADDSEEIETACITDTLVRAGVEVTTASVMPEGRKQVKMARGLNVVADATIAEVADREFDAIALPGGMPGAENLRDSAELTQMLKAQAEKNKLVAAVCASPAVVLNHHGLLPSDGEVTCFPAPKFKEALPNWSASRAVVNGNIITSQGPGTSLEFALKLVEQLCGAEKAKEVEGGLLLKQ